MTPRKSAEFDGFAVDYDGGIKDPLKKFSGGDSETFLEQKAAWLLRHQKVEGRLLDFGCGTGTFLRVMHRRGVRAQLEGADISSGMLELARATNGANATFHQLSNGSLPFPDASFDIVTVSCVFHHIPLAERSATAKDLLRVLKPGGFLAVFEHNPWNPLTRLIVARCALDTNAILLSPGECGSLIKSAAPGRFGRAFFLFFPPRWKWLWSLEDTLAWCPAGAQYVVYGNKR